MPKDYKYCKRIHIRMNKAALVLVVSLLSSLTVSLFSNMPGASAHTTLIVGDVKIEAGWAKEPSLVNQLNGITLEVTHNSTGQPATNAVAELDASVKKGSDTKPLDFRPTEEVGVYEAEILPTQVGQLDLILKGSIAGQAVDNTVKIEDVEDTAQIEFPPRQSGGNPIPEDVIDQLQQVISDLNTQVGQATSASDEAVQSAKDASTAAADLKTSADRAYVFGMVGVGLGVAGIAIGVISMTRKDKV